MVPDISVFSYLALIAPPRIALTASGERMRVGSGRRRRCRVLRLALGDTADYAIALDGWGRVAGYGGVR